MIPINGVCSCGPVLVSRTGDAGRTERVGRVQNYVLI